MSYKTCLIKKELLVFIFQTLNNEKESLNLIYRASNILYSSYWFKDTDFIINSITNEYHLSEYKGKYKKHNDLIAIYFLKC